MYFLNAFGGHFQPVQLMYGRTASFKYFELLIYAPILYVQESWELWLYAFTSTVQTCYKCSTHSFISFGCYLPLVQLKYGCTSKFKWSVHMYCGIGWSYHCTPLHQLYYFGLTSPMFHVLLESIWWPILHMYN